MSVKITLYNKHYDSVCVPKTIEDAIQARANKNSAILSIKYGISQKMVEALYVAVATEQKKIDIEWLRKNVDKYFVTSSQADDCYFDIDKMIADFRKLLEE